MKVVVKTETSFLNLWSQFIFLQKYNNILFCSLKLLGMLKLSVGIQTYNWGKVKNIHIILVNESNNLDWKNKCCIRVISQCWSSCRRGNQRWLSLCRVVGGYTCQDTKHHQWWKIVGRICGVKSRTIGRENINTVWNNTSLSFKSSIHRPPFATTDTPNKG